MKQSQPIQGELQSQLMAVMWRLETATVEQVRAALPARCRSAYTTIQTVLNRLADRGLLSRRRVGHVIVYAPAISEADHLSRTLAHTLAGASNRARQTALAKLLGDLSEDELEGVRRLVRDRSATPSQR